MAIITPPVPSTDAFSPPAQMQEIVWAINPLTPDGTGYDIFNEFTDAGNGGNLEVIASKIQITLTTFQGEWAPLPDFGLPALTLNSNADNPDVMGQIIANAILTVENVNTVDIASLEYVATTRQLSGTFNVNTVFGVTQVVVGE